MTHLQHLQQTLYLLRFLFALYAVSKTVWVLTIVFVLYAGWSDLRTGRIPNWLTVSGLFTGLAVNLALGGRYDAAVSLEGAGLALALFLPLVLLRAFGAGDWKLMGAIGALIGWKPMLLVVLLSFVISGFMGVVLMLLTKRVKSTARNMFVLVQGFLIFGLHPNPEISLDNPALVKLPFGAAVAMAILFIFTMSHWATS